MIFISYRISDSCILVDRFDADLAREFGRASIYRDQSGLRGGEDWTQELEQNAKSRRLMFVVIGASWQKASYTDADRLGILRLSDSEDWVRKEITFALAAGNTVIPLLGDDASMPSQAWLSKFELAGLYKQQAMRLRTSEYDTDLAKIRQRIREVCHLPDSAPPRKKTWSPAELYPLQPAPHFQGRAELLADLSRWATAPNDPARVVALVAAGGTGKTALAERVLDSLRKYDAAGVFVWSFYENTHTEAFLEEACRYFTGADLKESGGLLEQLQRALSGELPHVLILDGLELVQAEGTSQRLRGLLEDPIMRRFLRWLAAGRGTQAKALITTRFHLPDLADWTSTGYREHELEDLSLPAARALLRKWNVRGTDRVLDDLADSVHRHALTIDVLASYLSHYCDGDPHQAPSFEPSRLVGTDLKTARLYRILTCYSEKLQQTERDLMVRLSAFPRGASIETLTVLMSAGPTVAGSLATLTQQEILLTINRLLAMGILYIYEDERGKSSRGLRFYSAHPFLKNYFSLLLGAETPKQIHSVLSERLLTSLDHHPKSCPTDPKLVDRYEEWIEHTCLSGNPYAALAIYDSVFQGYIGLCNVLNDYERGVRMAKSLLEACAGATPPSIDENMKALALYVDIAMCCEALGDLKTAECYLDMFDRPYFDVVANNVGPAILTRFADILPDAAAPTAVDEIVAAISRALRDVKNADAHLAKVDPKVAEFVTKELFTLLASAGSFARTVNLIRQGQFNRAFQNYSSIFQGDLGKDFETRMRGGGGLHIIYFDLSHLCFLLGRMEEARKYSADAIELIASLPYEEWGLWYSELLVSGGEARKAQEFVAAFATDTGGAVGAIASVLEGRIALTLQEPARALECLAAARLFARSTDHAEVSLNCSHLAAEIARHAGDFTQAADEALNGILLADSCGFGRLSIDIRLELAKIHLAAGNPSAALEPSLTALDLSEQPNCGYAWGKADALHLLAVAHARLGDDARALEYQSRAGDLWPREFMDGMQPEPLPPGVEI